jgi:hypothetical protein
MGLDIMPLAVTVGRCQWDLPGLACPSLRCSVNFLKIIIRGITVRGAASHDSFPLFYVHCVHAVHGCGCGDHRQCAKPVHSLEAARASAQSRSVCIGQRCCAAQMLFDDYSLQPPIPTLPLQFCFPSEEVAALRGRIGAYVKLTGALQHL